MRFSTSLVFFATIATSAFYIASVSAAPTRYQTQADYENAVMHDLSQYESPPLIGSWGHPNHVALPASKRGFPHGVSFVGGRPGGQGVYLPTSDDSHRHIALSRRDWTGCDENPHLCDQLVADHTALSRRMELEARGGVSIPSFDLIVKALKGFAKGVFSREDLEELLAREQQLQARGGVSIPSFDLIVKALKGFAKGVFSREDLEDLFAREQQLQARGGVSIPSFDLIVKALKGFAKGVFSREDLEDLFAREQQLQARGGVSIPSFDLIVKALKGFAKGVFSREDLEELFVRQQELQARGGVSIPSFDLIVKALKGFAKGVFGREELELMLKREAFESKRDWEGCDANPHLCEKLIADHKAHSRRMELEARGGVSIPSFDLIVKALKGFAKGVFGREDLEELFARDQQLQARGGVSIPSFDLIVKALKGFAKGVFAREDIEEMFTREQIDALFTREEFGSLLSRSELYAA